MFSFSLVRAAVTVTEAPRPGPLPGPHPISSPDGDWCESGISVKQFGDLPPALRPYTPRL